MAYSKSKLKSNGGKAFLCFKPFLTGNKSDKLLPTRTLLYVSFRILFFSLTTFMRILDSMTTRTPFKRNRRLFSFQIFSEYYRDDYYYMDETVLFYRKKHGKTIIRGTVKGHKKLEGRFTLEFCSNSDCNNKRRLTVTGKSAKPRFLTISVLLLTLITNTL